MTESNITEQLAAALRDAVKALNTAASFRVPSLNSNSYAVASQAERALAAFSAAPRPERLDAEAASAGLQRTLRNVIARFDALGFDDPDAPVDGGDCVELVGELLPLLRAELPADAARAAPGEADERKRLAEFLVRDWESSFEQDADSTFGAVEKLLRTGHAGYDAMAIEDLRLAAADTGYGDDLDDEAEGEMGGPAP